MPGRPGCSCRAGGVGRRVAVVRLLTARCVLARDLTARRLLVPCPGHACRGPCAGPSARMPLPGLHAAAGLYVAHVSQAQSRLSWTGVLVRRAVSLLVLRPFACCACNHLA